MEKSPNIVIIACEFNKELTQQMAKDARETLIKNNIPETSIREHIVPGALELPIAAKWALEAGADAVLCFGVVIRGETTHYDEVCRGCTVGIQQLMLEKGSPVLMGVLTTETYDQAAARVDGRKGHKGRYCAEGALHLLDLKQQLSSI